jgi:class 3 adenylate cyclase/tetratricopeptide (TPR) repeat protein
MSGEARKTVTVVFADVTGSTSLGESLDPEALRDVMSRYFDTAQEVLEKYGATVEKFIGDAVMAVFGIPTMHEDDALRAVRAAAELRDRLDGLNDELERARGVRIALRTGVNTGEVVVGDPSAQQFYATGDAVNVAARLEQAAGPGEILIGDSTRQLIRDAVELEAIGSLDLKGKSEAVAAWRLAGLRADAAPFTRHLDSPLVGRSAELSALLAAYERVRDENRPLLVTVIGTPGVGKSRLVAELGARIGTDATVVVGRCLSYGEGITFWPLVEIILELERLFPLNDLLPERALEQLRTVTGEEEEGTGSTEESFSAIRTLFEGVAIEKPLVVVLDDVHWAEPTLLDLVEQLLDFIDRAPVLVVGLARPEFLERRPFWASQRDDVVVIRLEPLSDAEAETLIDALLADRDLSPSVRQKIGAASDGNPLFVEQMVAMLAENGHGESGDLVPPTIQALLAARIDELSADERAIIEPAAVIGQEFWRSAVVDLVPADLPVGGSLQRLIRKELIGPSHSTFAEEDAFRFRHILIRDAAYAGIPKVRRAELHERFVDWLEGTMPEFEEIIGYHLEQAFRFRSELGPVGEPEAALAHRAMERLAASGHRAFVRGDVGAAANLLGRAVDLARPFGSPPIDSFVELGSALADSGELESAESVLREAADAARKAGDRRGALLAEVEYGLAHEMHRPHGGQAGTDAHVQEMLAAAQELGDDLVLAKVWRWVGDRSNAALQCGEWAAALEKALAHAERAGYEREVDEDQVFLSSAVYFGPTPVDEAIERCEEMLRGARRRARGGICSSLAGLRAMRGEFEAARALFAEAEEILRDLGFKVRIAGRAMIYGDIEELAGNLPAAEAKMRQACETLEQMGETGRLSTLAGQLAHNLYEQGNYADAERYAALAERVTPPDDVSAESLWRSVRAKLAAREGKFESAETLAREAAALLEQSDALDPRGKTLLDLAEVLALVGRREEAADEARRALDLFEAKGNLVASEWARACVSELTR